MKHLFTLLIALSTINGFSQNYWQQKADYKIEVTLNDTLNELNGFIDIDYKNNSPETLTFIYFHLWPNAYKDQSTPLAKQMLENGKTKFWYSKPSQRGFMDKINFKVNGEVCRWIYDSITDEICKLMLNTPLKPGESVHIFTPFHVKLPETFSRMGHIGQSYQITQWYPKPAVFDKYGWHPIPYLDQGEFYSEFGSFDVSITLPKNYVVGATGDLQDEAEIKWMDEQAAATAKLQNLGSDLNMAFPPSAKETKTIHFKQTNIHDFGWFADKRYHVLKGEVELPVSKKKVTTWALFTNNQAKYWAKAPEYLHDAIYYYSLWIGEYPYKHVTAVDGTISAGSGMEYPNITVIGEESSPFSLDDVMTHEVGHNWFYGMLGTNERDHAWMDEGINSYYEFRYLRTKYPYQKLLQSYPLGIRKFLDLSQYKHKYEMDLAYQFMARENRDQPIDITSAKFTDINYGTMVYGKSMLIFDYLEAYLGTELFDKVMKKYFEAWKYKHPQPEDIRKIFEQETGKTLSWFFDDLLKTTKKIDYKIAERKERNLGDSSAMYSSIVNVGDINSPVSVSVVRKDSIVRTIWMDGFKGTKFVNVGPVEPGDNIQIDPQLEIPEINRRNNIYKINKLAHRFEKIKFRFLVAAENQERTSVLYTPYLGWNNYDKAQLGFAVYSPFAPSRKFNYMFVPAYAFGSRQLVGFTKLSYTFYPESVQHLTIGLNAKRFSYLLFPTNLMFNKLEPYANIELNKKNARSTFTNSFNLRSVVMFLGVTDPYLPFNDVNFTKKTQHYYVNEVRYQLERNSTLHPFNFTLTLQQGDQFAGIWGEGKFMVSYKKKNQGLFVRVFAGGFPIYFKSSSDLTAPNPRLYLSNSTTNTFTYWLQKDYMFDENFVDRNGRDQYLGRQVALTGGAFRSLTTIGSTTKFLMATNISSSILRVIPIHPFASMGMWVDDFKKPQFGAELGLSVVAIRDLIEIHLPLVTTKNISDNQKVLGLSKWYQKISFTFKIKLMKPIDILRQIAGI